MAQFVHKRIPPTTVRGFQEKMGGGQRGGYYMERKPGKDAIQIPPSNDNLLEGTMHTDVPRQRRERDIDQQVLHRPHRGTKRWESDTSEYRRDPNKKEQTK